MPIPKFPELEEQILKDWANKDIFKKTLAKPSPKGNFVFYDGPPTANGIPHIGHVETRAFKDIIPRFKTMQGFHVERKAGWDTQGLAVELEVEKDLGISGKKDIEKFGIAEFNAKAKESVWKYKDLWEKMTNRVGFWLDTEHPYVTYEPEYIESLWWIFKQIWDQKLLEQDYKVVPYCPRCGTALSSHEVAQGYQNVEEDSVYVKFELVDEPGTFVLAWTTTPWTLPGNVALAVGKNVNYIKTSPSEKGERYIIAKNRFDALNNEEKTSSVSTDPSKGIPQPHEDLKGSDLINLKYHRLFDFVDLEKESGKKAYYIADADFVTTEDGTGVVHTAVMYGEDDFNLGKKLDLPKVHTVDLQGKFNELVKPWAGLEVKDPKGETQEKIIAWLQEHGKLYKVEKYKHDYPFCWRCKHPLLYYAKTSWFIMMSKLRDELIANNEKVNWYPNHIKEGRFGEWLREVKDWAISRERYWGTPLPIWQCDNTDCKHQECLGGYQELVARAPARNRYIFLRHGKSVINESKTLNTVLEKKDIAPLTDEGQKQAKQAAQKLKAEKVDAIYMSPFRRARETAEIIGRELGLTAREDERLKEFSIGHEMEGKTLDEYHRQFPTLDRRMRLMSAPPGGETWLDMRTRIFSLLQELDRMNEGKTFLLVTHGDPTQVVRWATELLPVAQIDAMDYPTYAKPYEVKFIAGLFQPDGSFDPHRPFIDGISWKCQTCSTGTMKRVPEVADAWFDSGAMPFAQHHYPFENKEKIDKGENYPAEYISEAIDQTRGWFYTLLAISTLLQKAKVVKKSSYENVVVLGFLNDAKGRKLSKSLKNYGDLNELFDKHGADALRWFMYTTNQPWDPKNFDTKMVDEGVKKTFLILMNVLSFYQLSPTTPTSSTRGRVEPVTPPYAKEGAVPTHPLDRWIHSMLNMLTIDVTKRLESYDITGAARAIGAFITELSTWYVRRSRDRFKSVNAAASAATLQEVLMAVSKLMAPFTPFLAEHVYHEIGGDKESVHLEEWPKVGKIDEKLLSDMDTARKVVEQGHALRAKSGLKVRQPLQQVVTTEQLRPDLDEIVRSELNVKELHQAEKLPTGSEWAVGDSVALDITVTDELKEEGLYRDLVREFNSLRKTATLQPSDVIVAHVQANTIAAKVIERFSQEFLEQVRAKAVMPSVEGATDTSEIEIDGETVMIGLIKT